MAYRQQMQRFGAFKAHDLELELVRRPEGTCNCCGKTTKRVWGFVHHPRGTVAAYYVSWTIGKQDHGAAFDLILGAWGNNGGCEDRATVTLDYRVGEGGSWFRVENAAEHFLAGNQLSGHSCTRADVIGTPLAEQVFAIGDAILLGDPRLDEVRGWK